MAEYAGVQVGQQVIEYLTAAFANLANDLGSVQYALPDYTIIYKFSIVGSKKFKVIINKLIYEWLRG